MSARGQFTFQEIIEQPAAWEDARLAFAARAGTLRHSWAEAGASRVLFTGCGSTYFLAQAAASLFESTTGVPAQGLPGSELMLFPDRVLQDAASTLLVCVSRSGTTTETLRAQEAFRARGGRVNWTITCYPESPLAGRSDLVLPTVAAQEQSVAQTRSFASMLFVAQLLAATIAAQETAVAQQLPALGAALIAEARPLLAELGARADFDRFVFLGSSHQHGVASEAMLKMTEMSLSFSSAYHFLEYRHGPMSMAGQTALISGLLSPAAFGHEHQVLKEMQALGATTLALNPTPTPVETEWEIALPQDLPAWARPVLYLPPLQLLAYYRAMTKGLDPDNPENLTTVIYLDEVEALLNNGS